MAQLNEQGRIALFDLILTLFAWFTLNFAGWTCFIEYAFKGNLQTAAIFMAMGSIFGFVFCLDMYFYSKNGDILERSLKEIIA